MGTTLQLPQYKFEKKIVTYFADKAVFAENLRLLTYKKQPDGTYVRADPGVVELEVHDLSTRPGI
jgi:hypothetical protein